MNKLEILRQHMKNNGISAVIIPSADTHLSEYIPECFKLRQYISGFTGSAGTLVVTMERAGVWTDGRYYIQAEKELSGSGIELYRASERDTIKIHTFLNENLSENSVIGFDGRLFSKKYVDDFISKIEKFTVNADYDPSEIWDERPPFPKEKAFLLGENYSGESVESKIKRVRCVMKKESFTHYLISSPECIMWLLNIRGNDVEHTPVMLSYLLIDEHSITLYVDAEKIDEEVAQYFRCHNISVSEYNKIYEDVTLLNKDDCLAADFSLTNYTLINKTSSIKKDLNDIICNLKCLKNEIEIENIKKAYVKENIALTKAFYEIYHSKNIDECDVSEIIEKHRKCAKGYFSASFSTIAAFGSNAAMMHYFPKRGECSKIEHKGMLLIDTGGQYLEGTTDTTRTLVMGELTPKEKESLTLVLKSHIAMLKAVFPKGTKCCEIDSIARMPLWQRGLDYRCSTGHGVGYMLSVHEGPQRLSASCSEELKPKMTITNEPGIYTENEFGIRIENHLYVKEAFKTEYAQFLCFEVLNFCPLGTKSLEINLLTEEEKSWINEYNEKCRELILPHLGAEEASWLISFTMPI